ncbi:hypothetical protein F5X97DRAFT_335234 [Nemania serpens]|nr:hypothetical protein F5X97DRAFT_335234 [Nemania serpens]
MAAPASKTIGNLGGKWRLNKNRSDPTDPAFQLQGISWLTRKIIANATIRLDVKQYTDERGTVHIEITQEASGHRTLDFEERELSDRVFGKIRGQTKFVSAEELDDLVQEKSIADDGYLSADWIEGRAEQTGPGDASHVFNCVRSVGEGWTATQVWGFQMVDGERRYVRNVVVAKDGESRNLKIVYDWISE